MRKRLAWAIDGVARAAGFACLRDPVAALLAAVWLLAFGLTASPAGAQQQLPDIVATDALRVCADPAAMPFSSRDKSGFENKIAEIIAGELKVPVRYYWLPQGPGFVRNTLSTGLCDVIIGYASGADVVQHTNPYYRSTYVLVVKSDGPLSDVTTLEDPRLKGRKIGMIAATPPVDHLLRLGLLADAKTYALLVDRRYASPSEEALADLAGGRIDGALLWGPIGGYFASKASVPLKVIPLVKETERPPLAFRVTMGIRPGELAWKHRLNAAIAKRKADIDKVLAEYGVPLLPDIGAADETAALPSGADDAQ